MSDCRDEALICDEVFFCCRSKGKEREGSILLTINTIKIYSIFSWNNFGFALKSLAFTFLFFFYRLTSEFTK